MHPNPTFRVEDQARLIEFARARGFGVLMVNGEEGPLASHIPFALAEDGARLGAHLVRSNPIWRRLREGPVKAAMAVSGPDGYVSPDWYGVEDQVPTWNYIAAHIRGELRLLPDEALRPHLDEASAHFEGRIPGKTPWTADKMDEEALARMMRFIAPVEMTVTALVGTWKLNQNKPEEVRLRAADAIEQAQTGQEMAALAALMRQG